MMAYGNNGAERRNRLAAVLLGSQKHLGLAGPRMSIIANVIFLLAAIGGIVATAQGAKFGPAIVFGAMIWSSTHTLLIGIKQRGQAPLDERERSIASDSMAVGASVTCVLVASWALLLSVLADDGLWFPKQEAEWRAVGFFIIGLMTQISNIAAAWMTPVYEVDFLDDD